MFVTLRAFLIAAMLFVTGCEDKKEENVLVFGTSADYKPFEYYDNGNVVGFEIDLAEAIAKKLGKEVKFKDMVFSSILAELQNGSIDVGVAAMSPTRERKKNYDFTTIYYENGFAFVFKKGVKLSTDELKGVQVACQLSSMPEKWMRENRPQACIVPIDNIAQAAEFINAGHADCVLVDEVVALNLCENNPDFMCATVNDSSEEKSEHEGCAMVVKKGSSLRQQINGAIQELEDSGELQSMIKKWRLTGG
jgi:polar amino acid transport system substrate-binding protein